MEKVKQDLIFNTWLSEFRPLLFKIINVYTQNEFDRNDLFQEIIVQIWRSIPHFKKKSSEHTWIYKIALNTSLKWISRIPKTSHKPLEPHMSITSQSSMSYHLSWIYDEISKLEIVDRSICLLMLDGFSYKEIANITGLTVSNVGVKLNRIKSHLKKRAKTFHNEI